jgi:hypothetical protein
VAIELDHVMEAALPGRLAEGSSSDVKRMSMLPEVAVWMVGTVPRRVPDEELIRGAAPLNQPRSLSDAEVPSYT